jgi:tight adherence protein C
MWTTTLQILAAVSVGLSIGLWVAVCVIHGRKDPGALPTDRSGWALLRSLLALSPAPAWFPGREIEDSQSLIHAGIPLTASQFRALRWLAFIGGVIFAIVGGISRDWDLLGWSLSVFSLGAGFTAPLVLLRWKIERRVSDFELVLPDLMDRLRFGLEAGLGFEPALRRASNRFPGVLGEELRRVLRQLDLGTPRALALTKLANRNPSRNLGSFVASIKQADRLGSSLTRVLEVEASRLRADRHRRAEEASRRLPVLIVFPLVFFFLPALLVVYLAPPLLHLLLAR